MDLVKIKQLILNIYNNTTQIEVKGINNIALVYNNIGLLQQLMTEVDSEEVPKEKED